MPSLEYADAALEYVQAQGWTANITELQEGVYMIGGARETDSGPEKMLLMIICEPMTEVEAKHLKHLIKTGRDKNVSAAYVTYSVEITGAAKEVGRSHNIGVIPSEKIRSHSEASKSDIDADESTADPDSSTQDNPSQASTSEAQSKESEGQDAKSEAQEASAGETENSSTTGGITEDRVDTQDSQSSYSDSEERDEEIEIKNPPRDKQIEATYSQSKGQAVVGKLALEDRYLIFKPNSPDELSSGENVEIPFNKVVDVSIEDRFAQGLKDILFGGGFRKRLKIETKGGDDFLFVVSNLTDIVASVERRIQETKTTENTVTSDRNEPSNTGDGRSSGSDLHGQRTVQNRFEINKVAASAIVLILMVAGGVVLVSGIGSNSPDTGGDTELPETVDKPATELLPVVDDFEDGWRGSVYTDGTAIFAAPDGNPVVTYNMTVYNNSAEAQSGLESVKPENIATDGANVGDNGYTYQIENDRYSTVFRDRNVVCSATYVTDGEISTPESTVVEYAEKCLESIRN